MFINCFIIAIAVVAVTNYLLMDTGWLVISVVMNAKVQVHSVICELRSLFLKPTKAAWDRVAVLVLPFWETSILTSIVAKRQLQRHCMISLVLYVSFLVSFLVIALPIGPSWNIKGVMICISLITKILKLFPSICWLLVALFSNKTWPLPSPAANQVHSWNGEYAPKGKTVLNSLPILELKATYLSLLLHFLKSFSS